MMYPDPLEEQVLDQLVKGLGVEDEEKAGLRLLAKMELVRRGSDIEITWKWLSRVAAFVIAIVIVGLWVAAPFVIKELLKVPMLKGAEAGQFIAGSLAALIAGTYCALAGCLNRTHVVVSRERIAIRHRPIPWLGNKEIEASNLKQLYTKEVHGSHKGTPYVTYEVHAIIPDDRRTKLVGSLESREQACFVEHEIEKYLGIEDTYVVDEM